jgi:hypothetical protein
MPWPEVKFDAADLRRFFAAVDSYLPAPVAITVIGGSAIALYGVSSGTMDVDTLDTTPPVLAQAISQAQVATGLKIPVLPSTVAQVPWFCGERLQREYGSWTNLSVFKLEPHDLALSKAMRGAEHDLSGIEALHQVVPLNPQTLVTRYLDEMGHVVGDPANSDVKVALVIERLFGEVEADGAERRIRSHRESASTLKAEVVSMERSAVFTIPGQTGTQGQLRARDGVLSFESDKGASYPEDVLRTGGVMLVGPGDGSSPPDLLQLRDLCAARGIKVGIGRMRIA